MSIAYPEPATLAGTKVASPKAKAAEASHFSCLVVGESRQRNSMFEAAADESGWQTHVCHGAAKANAVIARHRFQLAIVDLADAGNQGGELREVAEALSRDKETLLMISGNEDDPLEEIWARQIGGWVYLPGVDETCDLKMVCDEARTVAEKLHPSLKSETNESGISSSKNESREFG
ncbi:MAG: hypothetical protein KDA42_14355 [Planctomycetales bacterium]|nr:hypothetical protein [Planctomycetales bacterium]